MPKAKRIADNDRTFQNRFKMLVGESASQEEIAKQIGITRQNVGNWLSGSTKPNSETITMIAKAYHVSADWLLGLSDVRSTDTTIRAINEYTALDEQSLSELRSFKTQHSVIKAVDKNLYSEFDDNITTLNQLFELSYIQDLAELLTELRTKSESFMSDKNLSADTIEEYTRNNEQCDILSFKIQRLLFALLRQFDAREKAPER